MRGRRSEARLSAVGGAGPPLSPFVFRGRGGFFHGGGRVRSGDRAQECAVSIRRRARDVRADWRDFWRRWGGVSVVIVGGWILVLCGLKFFFIHILLAV